MRNYCRVYHTSMGYLQNMSMPTLLEELSDAIEELRDEQAEAEKRQKQMEERAKRGRR